MPDRITLDVDEARAIVDGWLTSAYSHVVDRIVEDLAEASDPDERRLPQPIRSDPLHDTEQAMSRGWR